MNLQLSRALSQKSWKLKLLFMGDKMQSFRAFRRNCQGVLREGKHMVSTVIFVLMGCLCWDRDQYWQQWAYKGSLQGERDGGPPGKRSSNPSSLYAQHTGGRAGGEVWRWWWQYLESWSLSLSLPTASLARRAVAYFGILNLLFGLYSPKPNGNSNLPFSAFILSF